jgi:peroxiredoxin
MSSVSRLLTRRPVRWALEGALLGGLLLGIAAWQARGLPEGPAPDFSLATLEGERVTRDSLAGKPALIVFWAPWCGVCAVESRNVSWARRLVGARAHVLSIAAEYESLASVQAYVERHGVDYPVLLGGAVTSRRFQVGAFPTAVFLDEAGQIKRAAVGYTTTFGFLWRLLL